MFKKDRMAIGWRNSKHRTAPRDAALANERNETTSTYYSLLPAIGYGYRTVRAIVYYCNTLTKPNHSRPRRL
jgi:hypothetical protein